ncbi:MAG: DUF6391 domain-containing protein [Chloroflexota bacterium]|nr:DUF6391 domain-containing protein [Chloroflexota bacterium]
MNLIATFADAIRPLLTLPFVRQTRRNHALEHATIHLLSKRSRVPMAGRSDQGGFVLLAELDTPTVERAVDDALNRLGNGERALAVHPNCGTNLVTAAFLVSAAAYVGLLGVKKDKLSRLPMVMSLSMLALFVARPIGDDLQRHITTDGDPADTEVVTITRREVRMPLSDAPITMHRVNLRSS